MAFSSIAHAGYMLVGLTVALAMPAAGGVGATLFYLVVYVCAALGVFAALAYLNDGKQDVDSVSDVAGLARSRPAVAAVPGDLSVFFGRYSAPGWVLGQIVVVHRRDPIALADLPGVSIWFLVLAVVGVLNAAVAAAYYLRIISAMYFAPPVTSIAARGGVGTVLTATACCLSVVALGVLPGVALRTAELADPLLQQSRSVVSRGTEPVDGGLSTGGSDLPVRHRWVESEHDSCPLERECSGKGPG